MIKFEDLLSGGDLRSIGRVNEIVPHIRSQNDFDLLFRLLYHTNSLVSMRAADAIEKITVDNPRFLSEYSGQILAFCHSAGNKELQWHLAQLLPRLELSHDQLIEAIAILHSWTANKSNSRIVRVNALQSLFDLTDNKADMLPFFATLEEERIPSLVGRIKRLRKQCSRS